MPKLTLNNPGRHILVFSDYYLDRIFHLIANPLYYLIVRIYIIKEEEFLLTKFGNSYFVYKKEVNAFFSKLKKYKP